MADIAAAIASVRAMEGFAPTSAMSSSIPAPVAVTASASASASATTGTTGTAAVASTNDAAAATSDSSADWLQGALAQLATLERQAATVECPAQCGARVNEIHLADHASVCPAAEVTCPLGCGFRCARRDLFERHLSIGRCTNYTVYCSSFVCVRQTPSNTFSNTEEFFFGRPRGCDIVGHAASTERQDPTHERRARARCERWAMWRLVLPNEPHKLAGASSGASNYSAAASSSSDSRPAGHGDFEDPDALQLLTCPVCSERMCVTRHPSRTTMYADGSGMFYQPRPTRPVRGIFVLPEQADEHVRACCARVQQASSIAAAVTSSSTSADASGVNDETEATPVSPSASPQQRATFVHQLRQVHLLRVGLLLLKQQPLPPLRFPNGWAPTEMVLAPRDPRVVATTLLCDGASIADLWRECKEAKTACQASNERSYRWPYGMPNLFDVDICALVDRLTAIQRPLLAPLLDEVFIPDLANLVLEYV